jgi:DNA-binding CsgD family transcriptional regulator
MNITKREFEVISLYTRGLTFKEIGNCLNIATRTAINYYMRLKAKDKSRINRAKKSRAINKQCYKIRLKEVIQDTEAYNREIKKYGYTFRSELSIKNQSKLLRLNYFDECLLFAYKSYHRFRLKSSTKVRQFRE